MAMHEIRQDELMNMLRKRKGKDAVFIYTPLCGTCQLAERMLKIVGATSVTVNMFKLNINYAPKLRDTWEIKSVPCLVLFMDGEPVHVEYAMRSVDYLYELLKRMN